MRYGLLGEKLGHSFSPQIHAMLGCEGYGLIEVPRDGLDGYMRRRDFDAINVTIPYKQAVMPYCDEIDPAAKAIGCVNTIINDGGRLLGYNTDFSGLLHMACMSDIDFFGKNVLILGTGGTSLTAEAAAKLRGANSVRKVSRSGEINYENAPELCADTEILVNTTPVGMYPHNGRMAIDPALFPKLTGVLDVVYNPLSTALVLRAKELGLNCSGGLPMLVAQAVHAEELFTGRIISLDVFESVLRRIDAQARSIILMGMPGCGKSSLGRLLAERTGRDFADIDELVERSAGMPIPRIFAERGESAFRDIESQVLAEAAKHGGGIIALGGGSVLREENRRAIAQNGFVVYIRRPVGALPTEGRPLSGDGSGLAEMYARRDPIYSALADCECENSGTLESLADEVLKKFENRVI